MKVVIVGGVAEERRAAARIRDWMRTRRSLFLSALASFPMPTAALPYYIGGVITDPES